MVYITKILRKIILIELGGIDNTEQEVNRSIAILAKAVIKYFSSANYILTLINRLFTAIILIV